MSDLREKIIRHVEQRFLSGFINIATGVVQIGTLGFVCPHWQLTWALSRAQKAQKRVSSG